MSSPVKRRKLVMALSIGLAVFGAFALRASFHSGPALHSDLRVDGPYGDWRSETGIALYYQNVYLREHANAWLQVAVEKRDPDAAHTAAVLLRQSLAKAPLNAFAWTSLAWAEVAAENAEDARAALNASWRTAPFSADLAVSRLSLATALALQSEPAAQPSILNDLRVARRLEPAAYAALLVSRPTLKPLAEQLDETETIQE